MLFVFTIEYHDELDEKWPLREDSGIISGSDMPNALMKLIEFYGEDNFFNVKKLYELEEPILFNSELKDLIADCKVVI